MPARHRSPWNSILNAVAAHHSRCARHGSRQSKSENHAAPAPSPHTAHDAIIHHMKRVSVSDLRYNFSAVERMLREGEAIEITKRERVIGKLMPVALEAKPQLPDFMARLRRIYGNRKLKVSGAKRIAEERDRY
jgi:antitoxin (DNA-binding transcriptional repressor) of toxin-antitoxin stability system